MDQLDRLGQMGIDVFIQSITYLPFQDVVSVCSANKKLQSYCNNPKYNKHWRRLIDNTFRNTYNYQNNLIKLWKELNLDPGTGNYRVYTQLVKILDPITQAMIYHRQKDMDSFDQFTKVQKFLAMFLLNQKDKISEYLPNENYLPFISLLSGDKISQDILNKMLIEMAKEGSLQGINYFVQEGANIHT